MKCEIFLYKNIKFRRYPDSKKLWRKNYFSHSRLGSLHRYIYKDNFGEIPKGYHIHHKDGNSLNNSIENLECVSPKQHGSCHSELAKLDTSKDIYKNSRKWQKSEAGKKFHKNQWKKRKKIILNCCKCGVKIEKHYLGNKKYVCEICRKNRNSPKPKKIKKIIQKYIPINVNCEYCGKQILQKTKRKKMFCSKNCKHYSRLKKLIDNIEKSCEICGKNFSINKYSKTLTCSYECRNVKISRKIISCHLTKVGVIH